ncbi:MAG TPA: hypothetical protein PKY81_03540 [bacterium]|nr:hypothetical protein [bacterium]HPN30009.1 hypothetical protein [bacterium]
MKLKQNKGLFNYIIIFFVIADIFMASVILKSGNDNIAANTVISQETRQTSLVPDINKFNIDISGFGKLFGIAEKKIVPENNKPVKPLILQAPQLRIPPEPVVPEPEKPRVPLFQNYKNYRYSGFLEIIDNNKIKYEAFLKSAAADQSGYFSEGDKIENAAVIKSITPERIILISGKDLYVLNFNKYPSDFYSNEEDSKNKPPEALLKFLE